MMAISQPCCLSSSRLNDDSGGDGDDGCSDYCYIDNDLFYFVYLAFPTFNVLTLGPLH